MPPPKMKKHKWGPRDNHKMFLVQTKSCFLSQKKTTTQEYHTCAFFHNFKTFHCAKQIPAAPILEQSCKQPQAQYHLYDEMQTENVLGHLLCLRVSTETAERHTVDERMPWCSTAAGCLVMLWAEVWRTGEVSVSYCSLIHAPTFPFWGHAVTPWVNGKFTNNCWW